VMDEPIRLVGTSEPPAVAWAEPASFEGFLTENQTRLFGSLCLMTGSRYEAEEALGDCPPDRPGHRFPVEEAKSRWLTNWGFNPATMSLSAGNDTRPRGRLRRRPLKGSPTAQSSARVRRRWTTRGNAEIGLTVAGYSVEQK